MERDVTEVFGDEVLGQSGASLFENIIELNRNSSLIFAGISSNNQVFQFFKLSTVCVNYHDQIASKKRAVSTR